ncbi:MAG: hypothetical protein ABIF87_04400 [Pseudomonadota bacterium]
MGDERILGSSDFVESVMNYPAASRRGINSFLQKRNRSKLRGINPDQIKTG